MCIYVCTYTYVHAPHRQDEEEGGEEEEEENVVDLDAPAADEGRLLLRRLLDLSSGHLGAYLTIRLALLRAYAALRKLGSFEMRKPCKTCKTCPKTC